MSDLLSRYAPSADAIRRRARPANLRGDRAERCGTYLLLGAVAPGCYVAIKETHDNARIDGRVFLRRFPAAELTPWLADALKRAAVAQVHDTEAIYELGTDGEHGFIVSQLVEGASLAELSPPYPWPVVLAILHDAFRRHSALCQVGILHDPSPSRLRFSLAETLVLCHGRSLASPTTRTLGICKLARLVLPLGGDTDLVEQLLSDADSLDQLAIACDALLERHPELDPILPSLLLSPFDLARAHDAISERLGHPMLTAFWRSVVG